MKKLFMVLPLVFLLCISFSCQQAEEVAEEPVVDVEADIESVRAEIQARSKAVVAAEIAADWETASSFFAPDAIVQPADAPQIQGREAQLELYQKWPKMAEFEGTTTAIIPAASGDMAYEYGVNRFVFETSEEPVETFGKYLLVWTKIDGEWMISALSFSFDAPLSD
jgi:ketosteroid isomerase-like protein